jgi:hypothetical protein
MQRTILFVLFFLLLSPLLLHAQSNDLSATVGVSFSPNGKGPVTCGEAIFCPPGPTVIQPVSIGPGISWQANFAHRVVNFKAAALYVELPVIGSNLRSTPSAGLLSPSGKFSSIFFTPSAQIKFLTGSRISPFASIGGGLADYRDSFGGTSSATGAVQVGGGLDFKSRWPRIRLRAEMRDFITGLPGNQAFSGFTSNHIQTLYAGGGVVMRFGR